MSSVTGIKMLGITEADNGDFLYELALTTEAQERIHQGAKALRVSTEDFLRLCIEEAISEKKENK